LEQRGGVVLVGGPGVRFRLTALASGLSASLFVITLVWRDWIELVFRIDPDRRSGSLEWLIAGGLFVLAICLGGLAAAELRRLSGKRPFGVNGVEKPHVGG
jgi:hypothetical protein